MFTPSAKSGNCESHAEDGQKIGFLRVSEYECSEPITLLVSEGEGGRHRNQCQADRQDSCGRALSQGENAEYGKDHGHGEVFEHEDGEDDRRFAVTGPTETIDQLGDDTTRRDVGDAAQKQSRNQPPTEQKPSRETWGEVQCKVEQPGWGHRAISMTPVHQ